MKRKILALVMLLVMVITVFSLTTVNAADVTWTIAGTMTGWGTDHTEYDLKS